MARTTISIPDDLDARIKALKKAGVDENWSRIAQQAFESVVGRHEQSRQLLEDDEMSTAIARLKTERGEYQAKQQGALETRGKLAGIEWAKKRATYEELVNLAAWAEQGTDDYYGTYGARDFLVEINCHPNAGEDALNEAIQEYGDGTTQRDEWEILAGDDTEWALDDDETYRLAFREGVLEFWDEVQDQL